MNRINYYKQGYIAGMRYVIRHKADLISPAAWIGTYENMLRTIWGAKLDEMEITQDTNLVPHQVIWSGTMEVNPDKVSYVQDISEAVKRNIQSLFDVTHVYQTNSLVVKPATGTQPDAGILDVHMDILTKDV